MSSSNQTVVLAVGTKGNDGVNGLNENAVLIESAADWPTAVGGLRPLDPSKAYLIGKSFSMSDGLGFPDGANISIVSNLNAEGSIITYTGTGTFFASTGTGAFGSITISKLGFLSTGVGATLHDFEAPSFTGGGFVAFRECAFLDWDNMGTAKNLGVYFMSQCYSVGHGSSISFETMGTTSILQCGWLGGQNNSISFFTLIGTWPAIFIMDTGDFTPESNESVIDIQASSVVKVSVSNISFTGDGGIYAAGSKTNESIGVFFDNNFGVQDSFPSTEIYIITPAASVIGSTDNIVPIAGAWTDSAVKFTTDEFGLITYEEVEPAYMTVSGVFSIKAGSPNQEITTHYLRGNTVLNAITAFTDAGGGKTTVTNVAHGLEDDERIYISGTTNYNGQAVTSNKTDDTFDITTAWVADDATGQWQVIVPSSTMTTTIASIARSNSHPMQTGRTWVQKDTIQGFIESASHSTSPTVTSANIRVSR